MLTKIALTPANRPELLPDEALLFVQNSVGLYEGKYKIPNYQNGFAYLTTHRACYIDNDEPRKYAVAVELKEVDRIEPYAGFLKSSPKITLYLQPSSSGRPSPTSSSRPSPRSSSNPRIRSASPPPVTGVWICTICSFSNPVPSNYIPGITPAASIPPCLTCGIKPQPSHLESSQQKPPSLPTSSKAVPDSDLACPRCTFHNHPSLPVCELCGESLRTVILPLAPAAPPSRTASPALGTPTDAQIIKFSFRAGGSTAFLTHLKNALIQRKWLLSTAPPVPRPPSPSATTKRVGIAGLERKARGMTKKNQIVIGSAFEDLESLKAAAKEVIALAESFARFSGNGSEAIGGGAAQALGLVSRDMFAMTSSAGERGWIDELARQVAEFLADDARGVLKKEGGVITLVDLWALYNRVRGIDLISPLDLEKATRRFEALRLPVRTRVFRSGLVVVQEVGRRDEETVRKICEWIESIGGEGAWGRGITAGEAAERFGWSLGVASEELEMAEERGALCREVGIEGVRFWRNWFVEV